ncbi:hypothetical protein P170DRAFT_480462 [Aspergillus steynii IBT 23096]|uniref:Uncharacterized protein n=1 Tax=Aspergillus steynii IBT 23096 TaxID=1392250 RepID=A0A2I2FSA2_9EURO|nr:uncharacterized protein P170DRAFT_480462 [Aspergillus steynii IBT 23096]PLB43486.1 hypothetical protein P170DRAFT_480462 [Aspergillus steynii IBT 23096]
MPTNPRLPSVAAMLQYIPISRPPPPYWVSLPSVWGPTTTQTPRGGQRRFEGTLAKDWKGTGAEDHTARRTKKGDKTDPTTDSSAAGMQEREESEGVAHDAKSQATTERGGAKHGKQAKKEHPKAPEPIIGMNDERAQKGS